MNEIENARLLPVAVVGCDFRRASSRWRSALVLDEAEAAELAANLRAAELTSGLIFLNTCNRNEWSVASERPVWTAEILKVLEERRNVAVDLLNSIPGVNCYSPTATFYLFPDVTEAMERVGAADNDQFRLAALENTGCSFCTRSHFGRALPGEIRSHARIAYSGIDADQIAEGLGLLKTWVNAASGTPASSRLA